MMSLEEFKVKVANSVNLSKECLRRLLRESFPLLSDISFQTIFDIHSEGTAEPTLYSHEDSLSFFMHFQQDSRMFSCAPTIFTLNCVTTVSNSKVVRCGRQCTIEPICSDFKSVIGGRLHSRLLRYGQNGFTNKKYEPKRLGRYTYYHWVERSIQFVPEQTDPPPLQLLQHVLNFDFQQAYSLALKQKPTQLQFALSSLSSIQQQIHQSQELKEIFEARQDYQLDHYIQISHEEDSLEVKELISKANSIRFTLDFVVQHCSMLERTLTDPYYQAICSFLAQTSHHLQTDRVFHSTLPLLERWMYLCKFYTSEQYDRQCVKLIDGHTDIMDLEYLLLFGASRKESEVILQNHFDQYLCLQKVAVISLYLKRFYQINQKSSKEAKTTYMQFIRYYEFMLSKLDDGISKHTFDSKSQAIEREAYNTPFRTFAVCCLECSGSQCLISLAERITLDQNKPKMKGHQYFFKENKLQLMRCIDCMELLSQCCVCLYPVTAFNGYIDSVLKSITAAGKSMRESIHRATVWCPQCFHGGHYDHMQEWLKRNPNKCPIANCDCQCSF